MPGFLITFEGGEGSGKSSAIVNLGRWLLDKYGIVPVVTREPGGTKLGEEIREILLHKDHKLTPLAESYLFQAARAQLVDEVIKPSLFQRMIVIVDRYIDSSVAYQGASRGVGVDIIRGFNDLSTQGLVPDVTFLMDLDPRIGLKRKKDTGKLDRIDSEDFGFHDRVSNAYLKEASIHTLKRWVVVNAELEEDKVNTIIQESVASRLEQDGFLEKRSGIERL